MKLYASRAGRAVAVLAFVGCGLGGELTRIPFQIPEKTYSLDTNDAKRWKTPPGGVPAVQCGAGGVPDCCQPGAGVKIDCQVYPLTCETQTCVLTLMMELVQSVNLGTEAPELGSLSGQQIAGVTLKAITYRMQSSLNVDVPPVDVYVAPAAVTSSASPDAKKIGTLPMTPAGKIVPEGEMVLTSGGADAFQQLAKSYATPFNVIAVTSPKVKGGADAPTGRLDMWIGGRAEIELLPATK